jgi:tetratricopeptide (TPR) repeat protein
VAYYGAYCQENLHGSGAFDQAANLPTDYVFPSRAEDLEVLSAALKSNPQDASAHYLIGTLYFSKGLADQALAEWQQARQLNPQIPVLHASLGRALLHIKDKPEEALNVFQEGLRTDGHNLELYRGIDQTLSILQKPAQERVAALQRYPDLDHMPTPLTYELILNLAEAGEFEKAEAMFHNRFFQREEGGTNVRQVWLEVELQKTLSLVRHAHCPEATSIADRIAQPVPDLPFTHDGLQPFLESARFNYLLGSTYKACNVAQKSQSHFTQASQHSNPNEAIWSWKASQELPNADRSVARQKLEAALDSMRSAGDLASGSLLYHAGMLDRELGNTQQANQEFRDALLQPDQIMTYHLTRLALSGNQP